MACVRWNQGWIYFSFWLVSARWFLLLPILVTISTSHCQNCLFWINLFNQFLNCLPTYHSSIIWKLLGSHQFFGKWWHWPRRRCAEHMLSPALQSGTGCTLGRSSSQSNNQSGEESFLAIFFYCKCWLHLVSEIRFQTINRPRVWDYALSMLNSDQMWIGILLATLIQKYVTSK